MDGLSDEQLDILWRLCNTTAVEKLLTGTKESVRFSEACRFWEIPEYLDDDVRIDELLTKTEESLDAIYLAIGTGRADLRGIRTVTGDDVIDLLTLHSEMKNKFDHHLDLVRHRCTRPN